ncbi:MAG: hypothetical protein IKQ43_00950 [Treponema sp.]|nr:hypothetical protein [Treponema sp.]
MKKVLFMTDKKDELNGIKIILLALSVLCCFVSYFGGRILPMGIVLLFPIFLVALVVSIFYIVKSTSIHAFDLFALYFLPFLICAIIGWNVDQTDSRRCRKKLLEAKNYVEKHYEENGVIPEQNDEYLIENGINIQSWEDRDYKLWIHDAYIYNYDDEVRFHPRP